MAEFIVMPKLGFDMREGVLNSWRKNIGEQVNKGDVVADIESDKATLELEAQVAGVLLAYLEEPGAIVPIGANLAVVGQAGEDITGLTNGKVAPATPPVAVAAAPVPVVSESPISNLQSPANVLSGEFPGGVKATPVARRVASEHQIDLAQVSGTGPDGRIRKSDVEAFLSQPKQQTAVSATPQPMPQPVAVPTPQPVVAAEGDTEIPTTRLRQAIARRMVESKVTVPHFYVTSEIDMAPALALRKQINAVLPDDKKVTVNDLIVKAVALALREFPNLNASFAGDKIIRHNRVNVGSAVSVEGGLLTVVQKDTDTSTLSKIASDNKTMIARARDGKIKPDDVDGGTFTVSNLGAYEVENFIAIINPPEAAILAVGTAREVPVVVDGQLAVGTRMKATVSADHRVTDGAEAARFMQTFKGLLENPMRLLL